MKRALLYLATFSAGLGLASAVLGNKQKAAAPPAAPSELAARLVSAPGRVEPVSEEVKVGADFGGKLSRVLVEEGDTVRVGQVIAVLENRDYQARIAVAEAQLLDAEARQRRVVNGARGQERREALAAVREAAAVLDNAKAELDRRTALFRGGDISRSDVERTEREYRVAQSRHEAAIERHSFIDADAREEDRARADADVALAKARLAEARALLDKTVIRAPISGTVLRKHFRAGETVPDKVDLPILTLGDQRVLRVRVEVDETDVARVHLGQRAWVTADAFGERKFYGRVVRVGRLLGKKNVRTDRPSERVDTKVLETLVELDPGAPLPAGLRVDVFIG